MSAGNPDLPGDEPDPSAAPVFAATITPHRSLGPEGFRVMMTLLCIAAAMLAVRFISLGFWPVSGFLGLDILGLYIAFQVSYRRARSFEEIRLTPVELSFRRVSHRGESREWHLNPLWTKLVRETHEEFGLQRLALVSRGERIVIGGALSPEERAHFADEFGRALMQVKRAV